jgi:hypothetical protein
MVHGPRIVNVMAVGSAPHLSAPSLESMAVGRSNIGPTPQITPPEESFLGDRKNSLLFF